MANTNKNSRNRQPAKSYSLRGDNNWETALNTFNFGLGLTMTGVWGTGRLVTVGAEATASILPEAVAVAIVDTATQPGVVSVWGSFRAEDSTDAIADKLTDMKDNFMGAKDDATDMFIRELDNKATAKAVMKLATDAQRTAFNTKLNSLDNDAYDLMLSTVDTALEGMDATDKAALQTALAAL